jgi:hypothetical protein
MWKAVGCRLLHRKGVRMSRVGGNIVHWDNYSLEHYPVLNPQSIRTLLSSFRFCSVSTIVKFLMGGRERSFRRLRFHNSERMLRGEVKRNWRVRRIKVAFTHVLSNVFTQGFYGCSLL